MRLLDSKAPPSPLAPPPPARVPPQYRLRFWLLAFLVQSGLLRALYQLSPQEKYYSLNFNTTNTTH